MADSISLQQDGRICMRCQKWQSGEYFGKSNNNKSDLREICKQCRSEQYREKHPNPNSRGYRTREKPGRGASWTPEEDNLLRQYYQSNPQAGTTESFARSIGRTRRGISIRAYKLGLTQTGHLNNNPSDKQKITREKIASLRRGQGKIIGMDEEMARTLFEDYRKSTQALSRFSRSRGFYKDGLSKVFRKFFPDEYDLIQEHKWARRDLWYKKGRAFEYRVRDILCAKKWWVLRSPQSRSPVDLVALKKGRVFFIQCKSGGGLLLKERTELYDLAESVGAVPILATRQTSRGTQLFRIGPKAGQQFDDVILD